MVLFMTACGDDKSQYTKALWKISLIKFTSVWLALNQSDVKPHNVEFIKLD